MKEDSAFSNVAAIVEYLEAEGWKIKKSSVYVHARQRKFHPRKDGLYHKKDIDNYAQTFLKKNDPTSPAPPTSLESIQKRRNEAEARKMEAQAEHWEIKSKAESGKFVEREAFERALVQRAMLFKSDLEVFAMKEAPEIIRLVDGNDAKVPDLVEYMQTKFECFLGRYAEDREFGVPSMPATVETDEGDPDDDEDDSAEQPIDDAGR